jgi:uncharacterized membrane protein YbhN (UPF0104 family)
MRRLLALLATPAGRAVRYLISIALLVFLIRQADWARLSTLRGQFSLPLTLVALLLSGLVYPLHAWRWWLLLRAQGLSLSLHWTHVVTWVGQFYNAFLLGGIGGDAARIFYLLRDAPTPRAGALATLVIDRAMGLVVLMGLAALALVAKTAALVAEPRLRWLLIAALAITMGGALAATLLLAIAPSRWPAPMRNLLGPARLASLTELLSRVRQAPRKHTMALFVSVVIWLVPFVAVWLLARAVDLSLPFLETCVAMSVAFAATALPISVGGHGVREGALLATLAAFGLLATDAAHDRALLLALLVWATTVFWSLVGGIFVLAAPRLLPAAKTPAP